MADPKLLRLTQLSIVFRDAANEKIKNDPALHGAMLKTLKPREMAKLQGQMMGLLREDLAWRFGAEPSDDFLKKNIAVVEKIAEIALRTIPVEKLVGSLPDQLRNQEDADALKALNAPSLASLCAYKPA